MPKECDTLTVKKMVLYPDEDTYVSNLNKKAIYGSDPGLKVQAIDNMEITLLKFLNLPTGKDLKLNLYCDWWWNYCKGGRVIPPDDGCICISPLFFEGGDWEEETLCWDPNGDNYWKHCGKYKGVAFNKFYEDIKNKWITISIPKEYISDNLTIMLTTCGGSDGCIALQFNSKEGTNKPYISE